jgi:hypothetical protein
MKLKRSYFTSPSLDDLELFEEHLEAAGVSMLQIHVLSCDDESVAEHPNLHEVQSFMKQDVVHMSILGAVVGSGLASTILLMAFSFELVNASAGWMPIIFFSVVVLGFSTWMGGFIGIQNPNYKFARFEKILSEDRHVFFVDLEPDQENILEKILKLHPNLERAGTEDGPPHWLINLQSKVGTIRHS